MAEVEIEGLSRFITTCKRAGVDMANFKTANQRTGEIVASTARFLAPRRSGNLALSIRSSAQARRVRILAGDTGVPYAAPIHWGWPSRNIAANPFASKAAQATESIWTTAYQKELAAIVAKVQGA